MGCVLAQDLPGISADSNAHTNSDHNSPRPKSQLRFGTQFPWENGPIYTSTNLQGIAIIYTRSTEVGQQEKFAVNPQRPDGIAQVVRVNVGYNDIYYVEEKPEWIHIGSTVRHANSNARSHWMTSTAAYGIFYAAQSFLAANPAQGKIAVNDMSLPFGGNFD